MVEFGEQLRRAREAKGMTQQSLAEQLYVTRQAVSRWECGDRYPDLITTKNISQILEVSLDDLLSGKEMTKVVERNPVIEKKSVNNIMIALYAFVVISLVMRTVELLTQIYMHSAEVEDFIGSITINILGLFIQIACFSFGLFNAIRETLSPKRTGVVIVAYFIATCFTNFEMITLVRGQLRSVMLIRLIIPYILGAIATYLYFMKNKNHVIFKIGIYALSVVEILTIIYTNYIYITSIANDSMMTKTVSMVLSVAVYGLIIYQTYTLSQKRKKVMDIVSKEDVAVSC